MSENNNNNNNRSKSRKNRNDRRNRKNRRGRRGGRRNNNRREKPIEELEREYVNRVKKDNSIEKPVCPICEKPIYIISQAIKHDKTNKPAHFDCIVKQIREANPLEDNEKVVYLGGGSFGIVQDRTGGRSKIKFFVKKRIQYEERESKIIEKAIESTEKGE